LVEDFYEKAPALEFLLKTLQGIICFGLGLMLHLLSYKSGEANVALTRRFGCSILGTGIIVIIVVLPITAFYPGLGEIKVRFAAGALAFMLALVLGLMGYTVIRASEDLMAAEGTIQFLLLKALLYFMGLCAFMLLF